VSGSLRAGTNALRAAADAVAAGSAQRVLVIASDCRLAAPGSALERGFGDGAVAFLVSGADAVATLDAGSAVADEIVDVWRSEGDPFVHSWEERFVIQEGYTPRMSEAVSGLLGETGTALSDYAHVALYAPDPRSHAGLARALGVDAAALQDPLFGRLGNAGAAFAGLQLAALLERARAGERVLLASYGDGAEALAFRVTDQIDKLEPRRGVSFHLARRRTVPSYDHYRKARHLDAREWRAESAPGLSATIHHRERDDDLSFCGQRCNVCGRIQFPAQRICESCYAKDDFDRVRLSDRTGHVVTYTFDFFFPTPDPPTLVTIVEIDGARVHLQVANCDPKQMRIGLPVEFELRRVHEVGGRPNYYWKGVPVPEVAS
jgi:uncharacterized OB-fold protein